MSALKREGLIAPDSSSIDVGFRQFSAEGQYVQASVDANRSHPYAA